MAETLAASEISQGLERMRLSLDHEIARLRSLQKKNPHIRPAEIHMAEQERQRLAAIMQEARIRMDALLLVQKG